MKTFNNKKLKRLILLVFFISLFINLSAQTLNQAENFDLNTTITGNQIYEANDYIKLSPGFSFTPSSGQSFIAEINKNLILQSISYNDNSVTFNRPKDNTLAVGSIQGIFNVSSSGAASYQIPIDVPPGTAGLSPKISIVYNSQGSNGLLGMGFSLSGFSLISRCGENLFDDNNVSGVKFDNTYDKFMLDGQRLIGTSGTYGADQTNYGTELESFSKIISYGTSGNGPLYFKVWTKDGNIYEYGNTEDSRIQAQGDNNPSVLTWLLNKVTDANGNYMDFTYAENNTTGEWFPSEILYTYNDAQGITNACNKVTFTYSNNRTDANTLYTHGSKVEQNVLLTAIKTYGENDLVKEYDLNYSIDFYSHLDEVTETIQGEQLNSTVFKWGDGILQPKIFTEIKDIMTDTEIEMAGDPVPPENTIVLLDGDFNGDGLTDIVRICYNTTGNGAFDAVWGLYLATKSGNTINYIRNNSSSYSGRLIDFYSAIPVDIDGDGITELLVLHTDGSGKIMKYLYEPDGIDWSFRDIHNYGNGQIGDFKPYQLTYDINNNWTFEERMEKLKDYIKLGDFDGDGHIDILYKCGKIADPNYYFWKIAGYQENLNIHTPVWNSDWFSLIGSDPFSQGQFIGASDLKIADFNGDGKSEVLWDNEIYEYISAWNSFTKISTTNLTDYDNKNIKFCDLNGDGNADVVYKKTGTDDWYIAINDGNNYFNKQYFLSVPHDIPHGNYDTIKNKEYIDCYDFNGDGKTDIMYRQSTWEKINQQVITSSNTLYQIKSIYYSTGNNSMQDVLNADIPFYPGGSSQLPFVSGLNDDLREKAIFDDFNGDGKIEFYDGRNMISFYPFDKSQLITSIYNGNDNYVNIEYSTLMESNHYEKSSAFNQYYGGYYWEIGNYNGQQVHNWVQNGYPYAYTSAPINVVAHTYTDIGLLNISDERDYKYKNALLYLRGKGFLGFGEIRDSSINNLIVNKTNFNCYNDYSSPHIIYPFPYISKTEVINTATNPESDISSTENIYHLKTCGSSIYLPYQYSTISNDYLNNVSSVSTITSNTSDPAEPDQYGNIAEITLQNINALTLNDNITGTIQWTTVTNNNYENQIGIDKWRLGLLSSTQITKTCESESAYISYSENSYDQSNGNLLSHTVEPRSPSNPNYVSAPNDVVSVTKTFNYGNIKTGMPLSTSTTYTDKNSTYTRDITVFGYDPLYRFVTSKTNELNQSNTFTYEFKFGNLLSKTDANNHTTSYTYDGIGRLTSSTDPIGVVTSYSYPWASASTNPPDNALYAVTTTQTGTTPVTTYYDDIGRALRSETVNMNGNTVFVDKTFDSRGRLATESLPYFSGGAKQDISYTYEDATNRLITKTGPGIDLEYQYSSCSTTVQNNIDGTYSTQNIDAAGNVTQSSDAGGSISYAYYSSGLNYTITDAAGNTTTITYDHLGNKLTLSDPDAGVTTYTYYPYGQLKTQTDARGKKTELQYDVLNRITQRKEPAANHGDNITNYIYDTKSHGIGLLSSLSTTYGTVEPVNCYSEDYTYDSQSRLISKLTNIDGTNYTESYTYDNLGRLLNYTYPYENTAGFATGYHYSTLTGDLDQVLDANSLSIIWESTTKNALGQIENYNTANGIVNTFNVYDPANHLLTNIETFTGTHANAVYKQKLEYTYNSKLQLQSRADLRTGYNLTETFTYDNMNRLTSSQVSGQAQIITAFNNATGNITNKTDVGAYSYNLPQPHAVSTIAPGAGHTSVISPDQQNITYTSFNKVKTITEGDNNLDLGYGAEHQRIKTVLKNNGNLVKTKFFIGGNYEKEILSDGSERNLYYIRAPNGVVAINEKLSTNISSSMHYVYKDNLGSYNVITDANGNIEENLSFDAWGRRRDPATWTYYTSGTEPIHLFDRGFTGHEHLDVFNLINMNGRVYDPIVGAFLSPDVFSNTKSTQGLNRYSYGYNNPLAYTDPSGYYATGGCNSQDYNAMNSQLQNADYSWFNGLHNSNTVSFNWLNGAALDGGWYAQPATMSNEDFAKTLKDINNAISTMNANNIYMKSLNEKPQNIKKNNNSNANLNGNKGAYPPTSPLSSLGDQDDWMTWAIYSMIIYNGTDIKDARKLMENICHLTNIQATDQWCASFVYFCLYNSRGYPQPNGNGASVYSYLNCDLFTPTPDNKLVYGALVIPQGYNEDGTLMSPTHIAFAMYEDDNYVYMLGGDQQYPYNINANPGISICGYPKAGSKFTYLYP